MKALLLLAAPALWIPLHPARPAQDAEAARTFAVGEAAKAAVDGAVGYAAKKHERALVVWGREGDPDDVALFDALRHGKTDAWPFYYEYRIVAVDASETDLARALGVELQAATPALTVLDDQGAKVAHEAAARFRDGAAWSGERLGAFLTEHAVEPLDAEVVLKDALARAAAGKKNLLVHFGAPW